MLRGRTPGFSLLEVTIALVIGGTAVAAAAALLMTLSSRTEAIEAAARANDSEMNGERLLRLLTRSIDASVDSVALRGDATRLTVRTRCETNLGWSEPCRVRLAIRTVEGSGQLIAERLDAPGMTVLRSGMPSSRFVYLFDARHGGTWAASWTMITVPAAVGVVFDRDTLVLPL